MSLLTYCQDKSSIEGDNFLVCYYLSASEIWIRGVAFGGMCLISHALLYYYTYLLSGYVDVSDR